MVSDDDMLNEALSAVMDGRATPADWARVNAAWAGDPALRERWALWQAAADGLRAPELPRLHREPEALLKALHAQLPAAAIEPARRRERFAPLAVAAGFVALALGLVALRPPPEPAPLLAAAPGPVMRAHGLTGQSFAQAAGQPAEAVPTFIDWGLPLTEPAAVPPSP